jgi:beta-lactamase regulating signal transducer with metallopeptidase domain
MAFWIFQNLVVTAALAALVLLLCRVGRIGPVARHALWVLVLVKFVTPPLVVWPWAAPDPLGVARLDATTAEHRAAPKPGAAYVPVGHPSADAKLPAVEPAEGHEALRNDHQEASQMAASIWPWLLGVWLTGSVFLVGLEGARLARLGRRIRRAHPVDSAIAERVSTLSAKFDLKPMPVHAIDDLTSPVVWCVGRPRLLWPADLPADASDACVDGLLVHELAHIKRRDHFVGWVEFAAAIVWWWNPLFWYVRAARREQAELACDAWVISALPNGRRAYAESLLTLSIAGSNLSGASPAAVLGVRASTRRVLERRLVMIMKGRVPIRLSWMGFSIVALMAVATLPAWATGPQSNPPKPSPTAPAQPVPVVVEKKVEQPKEVHTVVRKSDGTLVTIDPKIGIVHVPVKPEPREVVVKPIVVTPELRLDYRVSVKRRLELPADGEELLKGYDADREALQKELEQKITARRAALEKAFTDLQEKYTKAGKLDEAVAIRDFIKAGMPGLENTYRFAIRT